MDLSNVRIREHFGLASNDTHTSQFSFLVSPPKNRGSIEKDDYVLVDHPRLGDSCQVLAIVKDITSYEEVAGSTVDRIGKLLATTEIIGYVDLRNQNKPMQKLLIPPNPGSRIYVPLASFLEDILNRNTKGEPFTTPLLFGKLDAPLTEEEQNQNKTNFFLDAQDLTSKHTLIAATTGAGKTYAAKVLVQELSNKTKTPIVVFDQTGEYTNLKSAKSQVSILAAKPEKAANRLENKEKQVKGLTEKTEKEILTKEVKPGQTIIVNGEGLSSEERRDFYEKCLKTLMKNRNDEITEPFLLVVEEAEEFKGDTLEQMVSEGRKNGIAICLISMHPIQLGGKVLAQISNQIVGKLADKDDVEYLTNMTNAPSGALPNLAVGEWIINGVNRSRPLKVRVTENLTLS
jgi:DNA helicase HerA-like ATPase